VHSSLRGTFEDARKHLCSKTSKVSAHYLIGRDGQSEQLVPLNKCAWGYGHAIGIELVSWGPLVLRDGRYFAATAKSDEVASSDVFDGAPPTSSYRYWHKLTEPQLVELRRLRAEFPSVRDVVSTKRAQDPWPLKF
jgi:hypothetical protein